MNESAIQRTAGFFPWIEIGDFRVQSYFVVISLVLCACAFWIPSRAEKLNMLPRRSLDLFIVALIGGLIGSRLLHIFWEEPAYYYEDPWRVFDFMSGGFVWYGGVLAAALAGVGWLKLQRDHDWREWFDFFAPVVAFGYAGGRFACVLTGCCFGRVCEWPFHGEHGHAILFRFPTQALAVGCELAIGALLLSLERRPGALSRLPRALGGRPKLRPGDLFFVWMVLHGLGRILMESLRADPRGPALGPVTISLLISLVLIAVGILGLRPGSSKKF